MTNVLSLYREAEDRQIGVLPYRLPLTGSMSIETPGGACYIGIDEAALRSEPDKLVHLAHEMGHCVTGAFYNRYARRDLRRKHENRADRWAIERIIPRDDLDLAVAGGCTTLWELAQHFGVTEAFMRKAVCWYTNGNLADELYF